MDREILASEKAQLYTTTLKEMCGEQGIIDYGAIIICRHGQATMRVDFKDWPLHEGAVITLFPNDVVQLLNATEDFTVEMLRYDPAMLREASLQLEQTVYHALRKDRCRSNTTVVTTIINSMFGLLRTYFRQVECRCTDQLVLYQLKAFFLGFYDWVLRNKSTDDNNGSHRMNELFNLFMEMLECDYKESHDVSYYASRLCITPKYLNTITKSVAKHTPKAMIDHYVILQLKLLLRQSDTAIKQIAWDFHFSDVSFFCRYFKQHTGMSPQQFRKSERMC